MPWQCKCGAVVAINNVETCPTCGGPNVGLALRLTRTNRITISIGKLEVLAGAGAEPVADTAAWDAAVWTKALEAPLLEAEQVAALVASGQLPAPRDVLLLRARVPEGKSRTLSAAAVDAAGVAGPRVPLPIERAVEQADGAFDLRVVCVRGRAEHVAELARSPLFATVDLTLEAAPGHALHLDIAGTKRTPTRLPVAPRTKTVELLELEEALFRTDSAALMPGGTDPATVATTASSLMALATCLRHVDEHPGARHLVAGHTDTAGSDAHNLTLSGLRARATHAALTGDRQAFAEVVAPRHGVADTQQALAWVASALGWPCDPGGVDGARGPRTIEAAKAFQRRWNEELAAGRPALAADGAFGVATWAAMLDAYEVGLGAALGADAAGLAALRARLVPLDPARPHVGCGEHHPIEKVGKDGYRSRTNRRVELVLLDPAEELGLPCHEGACAPAQCVLYDPKKTRRRHLPVMLSALPWTAVWKAPGVRSGIAAPMRCDAPGLPAGQPMTFVIELEGGARAGEVAVVSGDGVVAGEWTPTGRPEALDVRVRFVVTGAGRVVPSAAVPWQEALGVWDLPEPADGDAGDPLPQADPTSEPQPTGESGAWDVGRSVDGDAGDPLPQTDPRSEPAPTGESGAWDVGRSVDGDAGDPLPQADPSSEPQPTGESGAWDVGRSVDGDAGDPLADPAPFSEPRSNGVALGPLAGKEDV